MDAAVDTTTQSRQFLRQTVATLAYRAAKALRGAPDGFADFRIREGTRTPSQVLAHLGDLMDWAYSMSRGEEEWHNATALPWPQEVDRFFAALKRFDDYLDSQAPLKAPVEKLFQGPVADALTHVGQITMLRRLADAPVKGENYSKAEIVAGRVGREQAAPQREFD